MALHNGATQRTLKSFITFLLEWGNAARNVQTHPSPVQQSRKLLSIDRMLLHNIFPDFFQLLHPPLATLGECLEIEHAFLRHSFPIRALRGSFNPPSSLAGVSPEFQQTKKKSNISHSIKSVRSFIGVCLGYHKRAQKAY